MKISILTPTYNRADLLENLYKSLIKNKKNNIQFEWLIMNDGSTDNTREIVQRFMQENNIEIKYYEQENKGKMSSLNSLMEHAHGELIIECDSDDYFTDDAFQIISQEYERYKNETDLYALCFLKYDQKGNNIGHDFPKEKTTMFDLYFKDGEDGEKALVYFAGKRKKYTYELEHNEKFITEARLHHKLDEKYFIKCYNKPIMICEYQKNGYTKNIQKVFKENPYGYYKYFEEILHRDTNGISLKKRMYIIKHYILFSYLTKQYNGKSIKELSNKFLYYILLLPGIVKSKKFSS